MPKAEKKKILIINGWLHSEERYLALAKRLSEFADVDIYEFEGFGKTRFSYKTLNILKSISWMLPITIFSLSVIKIIPKSLIKLILSKISLLTIQDEKSFDDIMFEDALRCNPIVAAIVIFQLAFDRFSFTTKAQDENIRFIVTYS